MVDELHCQAFNDVIATLQQVTLQVCSPTVQAPGCAATYSESTTMLSM